MSVLDDDPYETAAKEGLDVVLPGPDELFLDIDDTAGEATYAEMLAVLRYNGVMATETKRTTSRGGNAHVVVTLDRPVDQMTRIALQACLGSDRKRELLAALRIILGLGRPPTVFFEVRPVVSPPAGGETPCLDDLPF